MLLTLSLTLSLTPSSPPTPHHPYPPPQIKPQEDDSVVRKRVAVRELYDKVKMSIDDVQYLQEKIKRKDLDGDTVRSAMRTPACCA